MRTQRAPVARAVAGLLAGAVGLGLLLAVPARADDALHGSRDSAPQVVAEVHLDSQAYEGPRGEILAGLRGRCRPGYAVAELALDFGQGDVVTPTVLGQPFPCDGRWHRQRVTSLEAFDAGRATLTARLTVVRTSTGEPAPPVVVATSIYVRPAARIVVLPRAKLLAEGVVRLAVRARCDAPWVLQSFSLSGTQGDFPTIASDSVALDIPCDGVARPVAVRLRSDDLDFQGGALLVDAEITLLDPEFFDPVTQARATRSVRVR